MKHIIMNYMLFHSVIRLSHQLLLLPIISERTVLSESCIYIEIYMINELYLTKISTYKPKYAVSSVRINWVLLYFNTKSGYHEIFNN